MRVALITSEFAGLPGSGGIGTYFRDLSCSLAGAGVDVEVFTSGEQGQLEPCDGIRLHHLGDPAPPYFAVHAAEALRARHLVAPFDVLECGELKAEGALAASMVRDVALVVRLHSPSVMLDRYLDFRPTLGNRVSRVFMQLRSTFAAWRRGLPLRPILLEPFSFHWVPSRDVEERNLACLADVVIVMNQEMRRFTELHWWVDTDALFEVANPLALSVVGKTQLKADGLLRLGFLGRLEPRKGVVELAKALVGLLDKFPMWQIEIAGPETFSCISGSSALAEARSILAPYGEQVKFGGPIKSQDVPHWLQTLDLCVFPSLWETFSYVVLEAAFAGKPIVATNTGAIPSILDGGNCGVIVPPGDVKQLRKGIKRLMEDAELRERMGLAARENVVKRFHPDQVTKEIIQTYRNAMTRRDIRLDRARLSSDGE